MIGFIGGGNMAEALIKGMVQSGMKDIIVSEPREDRRAYLEGSHHESPPIWRLKGGRKNT